MAKVRLKTRNGQRFIYFRVDDDGDLWVSYSPPHDGFPVRTVGVVKRHSAQKLGQWLLDNAEEAD